MVYTAANASLAVLEMLVHLEASDILLAYSLCRVQFDDALVEPLDRAALPAHWRDESAANALRVIGDAWAASKASAILRVPSVIIQSENCFLINPVHSAASSVAINPPRPFTFDERLFDF
jgi:RES domain-containing protein